MEIARKTEEDQKNSPEEAARAGQVSGPLDSGSASQGEAAQTPGLPELQEATLSEEQVTQYLGDLSSTAEGVVVRVKDSARGQYRKLAHLAELHSLMLKKHLWGAQVRYKYKGVAWVDTLLVSQAGVRLIRMRNEL